MVLRVFIPACTCLLWLMPAAAGSTATVRQHLSFEYADDSVVLPGWYVDPAATVSRDTEVVHGGAASAKIVGSSRTRHDTTAIYYALNNPAGRTLRVSGFLKTDSVAGFAGLWLRLEGTLDNIAWDKMRDVGLTGTNDWAGYSVELPLDRDVRSISFGVHVNGAGTVWADDLDVSVDGKSLLGEIRSADHRSPLELDREFDDGSGIGFATLSDQQAEALALLGKVWGFLKYHHPAVTSGTRHWDYDLFRVLPSMLDAGSREEVREVILRWLEDLGPVPPCSPCAREPTDTHLVPRLAWIASRDFLGGELRDALVHVYRNRSAILESFYVGTSLDAGNPLFLNEPAYEQFQLPDAGFRLLSVFRFWNMIEYWFPYRNLIDESWDAVLTEFIQRTAGVGTVNEYHLELVLLIAKVSDTHAKWHVHAGLPPGRCLVPVPLRFLDGELVVWGPDARIRGAASLLEMGDVILSFDGTPVREHVRQTSKYYPASNESAQLRDMTWTLTRGACEEELSFEIRRGTQKLPVLERRAEYDEMDFGRYFQHDRPGEAFQQLSDSISYLKLSAVSIKDVPEYLERASSGDLIIDIRGYPAEPVVFALGRHLVSAPTPFAKFTMADLSNPGAFAWTRPYSLDPEEPHFGGKVVLLVDETTQSQAEYTAMAFRAAPSATVVGSTTAGADGDYSSIVLPGGVTGGISGIGVFYPDQRQTQRVGIVPDVWARPTIDGIRDGRDEVLEAGIRIVLRGRASDAEIRRMALRR